MKHCDSTELLRSRNLRVTRKKIAILGEIIRSDHPLSASEIHSGVSSMLPVDLVTVYRTLNVLRESRLIREIQDGSDTVYYEIACAHNPVHPHFKCTRCHRIHCLDALSGEITAHVAQYAAGCEIADIAITLSGICQECQ